MMREQYTLAFKIDAVRKFLKEENTLAWIASEGEVHPTQSRRVAFRTALTPVLTNSSIFHSQQYDDPDKT